MEGQYDSYGRCFIEGTQVDSVKHKLKESHHWDPYDTGYDPETYDWKTDRDPWHDVCDLNFDNNPANGIAAVHTKCWTGKVPTTQSANDPDQGWGDDMELLGNTNDDMDFDE